MNVYESTPFSELVAGNAYPGRGIIVGMTPDGKGAIALYFIMGRSVNSRNRVFAVEPDGIRTQAADPKKLTDPSLIIYHPVRRHENSLIVTNGDQTDTVRDALRIGGSFESSLETRAFEPDAPNFTPRISAILNFGADLSYKMSILKSSDAAGGGCNRHTFAYKPTPGTGHFLHTYCGDGNPLPTFVGEPERVRIGTVQELVNEVWNSLDEANRISLWAELFDLDGTPHGGFIRNKYESV